MDELKCPICDKEMKYKLIECETGNIPSWNCDNGHERLSLKFDHLPFLFIGEGCYFVSSDNSSCERAISRMKKEYEASIEKNT